MSVTRYRKTGPDLFAILHSLSSAIYDGLDTLYESNAAFSQFLWSASMIFVFLFPFLASSCLVFLVCSCLLFSFRSFFVFSFPCLLFPFVNYFFICFGGFSS